MKGKLFALLLLAVLLIISLSAYSKTYNLEYGSIHLKYSQNFPIRIEFVDLINGDIASGIASDTYSNRTEARAKKLDLSILAKRGEFKLYSEFSDGIIFSHTSSEELSAIVNAGGADLSLLKNVLFSKGKGDKAIVTIIADGKSGLIKINKKDRKIGPIPFYVIVGRKLDISHNQARSLIREHGKLRIQYSLKVADRYSNKRNGLSCSGDLVQLNDLGYQSIFGLFLHGPNARLSIVDSVLRLNLLCGNTKVDGIGTNITVSNTQGEIVLLDPIVSEDGEYIYDFKEANWLNGQPQEGNYKLFVDLGPTLSRKIPIRISRDGSVSLI